MIDTSINLFQSSTNSKEGKRIGKGQIANKNFKPFVFTPTPCLIADYKMMMFNDHSIEINEVYEKDIGRISDSDSPTKSPKKFKIRSSKTMKDENVIVTRSSSTQHSTETINRYQTLRNNTPHKLKNKKLTSKFGQNTPVKKNRRSSIDALCSISEEEIRKLTNSEEEIENFYCYTKNCLKTLINFKSPTQEMINKCAVNLPFTINSKKRLAVFDLDETLIHCDIKNKETAQNIIEVSIPYKGKVSIGINVRPHWKEALKCIKKKYHIVIYTASHQSYADAVLDFLDPKGDYFEYRLYRNNCIQIKEDDILYYIKDLRVFKYIDLKDIVIIDNSVLSFAFHMNNGIPIVPYFTGEKDIELLFLARYLKEIAQCSDLSVENCKILKLNQLMEAVMKELKEETIDDSIDISIDESSHQERLMQLNNLLSQFNPQMPIKDDEEEEITKITSLNV